MLFLLNDTVIEIDSPEAHLLQRWRDIGCDDPRTLRAQDAVEIAARRFDALEESSAADVQLMQKDIAALIISKTGANSLILKPTAGGDLEPRLRDIPSLVLETYLRGAANDRGERQRA